MNRQRFTLLILLLTLVLASACANATPQEEPDLVATQVAVERSAAATLTAEAQAEQPETEPAPTETPTPTTEAEPTAEGEPTAEDEPTATPTSAATDTPTPVPPTATPTQPAPTPTQIVIGGLSRVDGGGEDTLNIRGPRTEIEDGRYILLPGFPAGVTNNPTFEESLTFRIEVVDTNAAPSGPTHEDGDGIQSVFFSIFDDSGGDPVYTKEEVDDPYCVFGGNDPLCPAPNFQQLNYTWPGTSNPIGNGPHRAEIVIHPVDGESVQWNWNFEIAHSGDQTETPPATQQPVTRILRPACGTNLSVPANAPVTLIHGIWASRGSERAAANAPYVQIELTIDGQPVPSQRVLPPVETIDGAICGSDYEDSYWVYNVADIDPLSLGPHDVQVTYFFTQLIEDGYGGSYSSPFTQQYTILVQ